ncbi:MAG TPA: hypothetical protein VGA42_06775, partial [Gemmatimonadales bacterium]
AREPDGGVRDAARSDRVAWRESTVKKHQPAICAALQWSSPPAMQIDPAKSYEAVFTTVIGAFRVKLFADVVAKLRPRDPLANPDYPGEALVSVEIVESDG